MIYHTRESIIKYLTRQLATKDIPQENYKIAVKELEHMVFYDTKIEIKPELVSSFRWSSTDLGYDFWNNIHKAPICTKYLEYKNNKNLT